MDIPWNEIGSTTLAITGWSLFALAVVVGLLLNMIGWLGNWVILGAVVVAWVATGFEHFGWVGLLVMAGLATLGEIVEFLAAGYGAAKFGGGRGTFFSALVGCLAGFGLGTTFIPIPIVGSLIGACLGAFLAATLYEYIQMERQVHQAMWTGFGAALGKVGGIFAKFLAGIIMLVIAALTF